MHVSTALFPRGLLALVARAFRAGGNDGRTWDWAERLLKGEAPSPLEHRIRHRDGRLRWIRNTPVPHRDAGGQLLAYDGMITDITERKRAEQSLVLQCAVSRQLGEVSTLDEALGRILESICSTFRCFLWDIALFWSAEPGARVLKCNHARPGPAGGCERFATLSRKLVLEPGVSLPGRVWVSGEPAWVPDVLRADMHCPRAPCAREAGLHGWCAFPIRVDKQCVGVIELYSREVQPLDRGMIQIVLGVGGQIGLLIERKAAEEQRRLSETRLQAILDHSPAVISLKDPGGRYLLTNRRFEQIVHAKRADLVGKTPQDLFVPEAANALEEHDRAVLATLAPKEFEETIPHDGVPHTYISAKFPLLDAAGAPYALCAISTDITERKQAELAVRQSQERLALVIEGSSDGIWDWDLATNEVYYSARWKSMLGYTDREVVNHISAWERLLHPADRDRALKSVRAYLEEEAPTFELEHRLRHKDGSYRWILSRGVALRDGAGKPVRMAGSHVDLTVRKQVEEQLQGAYAELSQNEAALKAALEELQGANERLQETQLQLIQAAKLESVGTLAAGVAHEVKNPLQTILMGVDYLGNNLPRPNAEVTGVLADMRDAVARANAIVRELLQLSAATDFTPKEADLNAVVERSLWLVNNEAVASQIRVVRRLGADLPRVRLDMSKMEQVFINLFINALQAMGQGGVLSVTTRYRRFGEDLRGPAFEQFKAGEAVVMAEVQDTGPGIAEGHLPKIFDPFFTTKPTGVGTGLGLSVVKKILDFHDAGIDIRNQPLGGVQVTLVFKAEPARRTDSREAPALATKLSVP